MKKRRDIDSNDNFSLPVLIIARWPQEHTVVKFLGWGVSGGGERCWEGRRRSERRPVPTPSLYPARLCVRYAFPFDSLCPGAVGFFRGSTSAAVLRFYSRPRRTKKW